MRYLVLINANGLLRYETRYAESAVRLLDSATRLGYNVVRVDKA